MNILYCELYLDMLVLPM